MIGGFDAPRRLRRRARRADPGPTSVELTRATVIDATPLGELEAADAWLERASGDDRERVTGEALELLNRAVAGHRVASADPWVADADLDARAGLPRRLRHRRAGGRRRLGVGGRAAAARAAAAPVAGALAAGAPGRAAQRPRRGARLRGADPARPRRPRPRAPARGGAPARDRARHRRSPSSRRGASSGDMARPARGARRPPRGGRGGRPGGFGGALDEPQRRTCRARSAGSRPRCARGRWRVASERTSTAAG